jgi:MFS family permease
MPEALRHRDFRLFWWGAVLSGLGSQFTVVAMAWQIYELTDSPLQIGLLGLARAVPQMLLIILGGLLADAFDRRRLLIISQIAQFVVSGSLVVATLLGAVTPMLLFIASALLALFTAMETPPRQAIVPSLVPGEALASALALNTILRHTGTILGPTLAGLLLAYADASWCYAVDALSWLAMLGAILAISTRTEATGGLRVISFSALHEGLIFIWHNQIILWFMLMDFAVTFFGTTRALVPIYARDIFAIGAAGLGWLYAAESVGSVVTAMVMSRMGLVRNTGAWLLLGVGFHGVCIVGFALTHSLPLAILLLAGTGVGNTIGAVLRGTINQLTTPDHLRGRVSAVNTMFTSGGPQLGQFRSGAVAEVWGAPFSALSGGIITVLVIVCLALVPSVRGFKLATSRPAAEPG